MENPGILYTPEEEEEEDTSLPEELVEAVRVEATEPCLLMELLTQEAEAEAVVEIQKIAPDTVELVDQEFVSLDGDIKKGEYLNGCTSGICSNI